MGPLRVAVLGGGTMGREIARVFVTAGHEVTVWSRSPETVAAVRADLDGAVAGADSAADAANGADLVVETIVEDLGLKTALLAEVEPCLAADGVLTTNTSSLSITRLARGLRNPSRLLGMHWFHPASHMPLVELVLGADTAPDTLERAERVCASLGKSTVLVREDIPGFVVNRLQYALMREALALVAAGVVSAEDIDLAVSGTLGPRWCASGLFELMDLAGLNTVRRVSKVIMPALSTDAEVPELIEQLCAEGRRGATSGSGFYAWAADRLTRAGHARTAFLTLARDLARDRP
ncbi:3-hydroxyacyl-CoA dehydrogenase family protein [Streptomyces sp. S3(2020)]|uniref:3-hydroxyacyl-CoA dehydrogenase family protein n=1 Tax=Streptomyces sp. S3(2020) TaxID=2732044 RepID=UPI001487D704|nr:3-hydroxyacyl-CoA dehydrogenase family protein [Streptomyces sp. S3(2020)]NNN29178.1 3-hydroxyacyl-CoA dehydrogenase family protein [Streptomyces sp. S3(2020)]